MQRDELLSRIDMLPPGRPIDDELAAELQRAAADDRHDASRLRSFDARVRESLHEVEVPEGLADRIAARLAAGPAPAVLPLGAGATPQVLRHVSRRRALIAAALATAAALAIYFSLPSAAVPLSTEAIAAAARERFAQPVETSYALESEPAHPAFPPSNAVIRLPDTRWHELSDFLGRSGVAYELRRGGLRAKLFVVKLRGGPRAPHIAEQGLPHAPRPSSTAGSTAAVWREDDLLYVLVVPGGDAELRHFLAPSPLLG